MGVVQAAGPCQYLHFTKYTEGINELIWSPKRSGGYHLGLWCCGCGAWIAWVPQNAFWLKHAPPKPETM